MTRTRPIDELAHARRAFFERGNAVGAGELPQTILRSSQRCRRLGLPERDTPSIEPVPESRLHEMRERNERLRRLARAELESLAADADGSGSITLQGSLANLQAAIDGLAYRGQQDYNGSDTLTVTFDDLGNAGDGGAATTATGDAQ